MVISFFAVANVILIIINVFSKNLNFKVLIAVIYIEVYVFTIFFTILAWIFYTLGNEQGIAAKNSDEDLKTFD